MALQLVGGRPTLRPAQEYAGAGSFSLPKSLSGCHGVSSAV